MHDITIYFIRVYYFFLAIGGTILRSTEEAVRGGHYGPGP